MTDTDRLEFSDVSAPCLYLHLEKYSALQVPADGW